MLVKVTVEGVIMFKGEEKGLPFVGKANGGVNPHTFYPGVVNGPEVGIYQLREHGRVCTEPNLPQMYEVRMTPR